MIPLTSYNTVFVMIIDYLHYALSAYANSSFYILLIIIKQRCHCHFVFWLESNLLSLAAQQVWKFESPDSWKSSFQESVLRQNSSSCYPSLWPCSYGVVLTDLERYTPRSTQGTNRYEIMKKRRLWYMSTVT